jgi:hypothetical protein
MRHYTVTSPSFTEHYSFEPPETVLCYAEVFASSKRDAMKQAIKQPYFSEWVKYARSNCVVPFKGLIVELAICRHGQCWICVDHCDSCEEVYAQYHKPDGDHEKILIKPGTWVYGAPSGPRLPPEICPTCNGKGIMPATAELCDMCEGMTRVIVTKECDSTWSD